MKKVFLTILFLSALFVSVNSQQIFQSRGIPASPYYFDYVQPDGHILTMRLYGDGVVHWGETSDGYTVLENGKGFYEYAVKNAKSELVNSGVISYNSDERNTDELYYLQNLEKGLRFSESQISEKISKHEFISDKSPKMGGFPAIGDVNLVMLLVNYSDTETTFQQTDFDQYMNMPGYDIYGSFKDFYLDASYGQLNVTTNVSDWITVSNTREYFSTRSRQLVYEALIQADATIDFSQFDNDDDGYVDGIAVIHQGAGQEASGDVTDIWSHSWNLSGMYTTEQLTFDGVIVDAYTIQPEILYGLISTIGVMCHEFGHNMGAPDYYDTDYESCNDHEGSGVWDLMAGGSWNMSGKCPANHNIFTKYHYFNWFTPVEIEEPEELTIENSYDNTIAYIYNTETPNEYFLLENRQKIGFDQSLPGHGLLIWHVDQDYIDEHYMYNDINACDHQGLYPKSRNNGINSQQTALPGNLDITDFNDFSNPNSISWNGSYTNKPISGISEVEGVINIDFNGGVENPGNFIAESSQFLYEINLSWTPNQNSDSVLLIYAQHYDSLGYPENGVNYLPGDILAEGGEVLYCGDDIQNYLHQNLSQSSEFFYRIFSDLGNSYSSGSYASAKTMCGIQEVFPYTEEFDSFDALLECWNQSLISGTIEWKSTQGAGSVTSPLPFSGEYYAQMIGTYSNPTINKLETQPLILQQGSEYVLKFAHYQPTIFSNTCNLKVYYTNSEKGDWILLDEYTEPTSVWVEREIALENPSSYYKIAFEGITKGIASLCLDKFTVDLKNSVEENNSELKIYPNPTTEFINIEGEDISSILIFDLTGKLIYSENVKTDFNSINVSTFSKGVYFMRVEHMNSVNFEKIVIE